MRFDEVTPESRYWINEIFAGIEARYWVHYNSYWEKYAQAHPDIEFKLIRVDEQVDPVGVIAYGPHFTDEKLTVSQTDVGEVIHLVIDESHQGRGYGRQAVLLATELLKARYQRIVIAHDEDNESAKRLYEEVGFRTIGTNYDGDPLLELMAHPNQQL